MLCAVVCTVSSPSCPRYAQRARSLRAIHTSRARCSKHNTGAKPISLHASLRVTCTRLLVIIAALAALLLQSCAALAARLAAANGVRHGGKAGRSVQGHAQTKHKRTACTKGIQSTQACADLGPKGELTAKSMCFSLSTRTR